MKICQREFYIHWPLCRQGGLVAAAIASVATVALAHYGVIAPQSLGMTVTLVTGLTFAGAYALLALGMLALGAGVFLSLKLANRQPAH